MIEVIHDDIIIRLGTYDVDVYNEVKNIYNFDCKDKTILDLGSHIGISAIKFIKNGALKVYCYEPDKYNYNLLLKNTSKYENIICRNNAVIGYNDINTSKLYKDFDSENTANYSLIPNKIHSFDIVNCKNIKSIIDEINPDIIKCDVEGSEYNIFIEYEIPDYIKEIALELHYMNIQHKTLAEVLKNKFKDIGFSIIMNNKNDNDKTIEYIHYRR